jgi:hypothetical protein
MKLLLENWRKYLTEDDKLTIPHRQDLVDYIMEFPNQLIFLDSPKGSSKGFGGRGRGPLVLPFDYGEYSNIINPADKMGWDVILVPSATENDIGLIPVGHVTYDETRPDKAGNDKIIIAPEGNYSSQDVDIIEEFFGPLEGFTPVEWY